MWTHTPAHDKYNIALSHSKWTILKLSFCESVGKPNTTYKQISSVRGSRAYLEHPTSSSSRVREDIIDYEVARGTDQFVGGGVA